VGPLALFQKKTRIKELKHFPIFKKYFVEENIFLKSLSKKPFKKMF